MAGFYVCSIGSPKFPIFLHYFSVSTVFTDFFFSSFEASFVSMATDSTVPQDQKKRSLEALERRFAAAKAELVLQQKKTTTTEEDGKHPNSDASKKGFFFFFFFFSFLSN